MKTLLISELHFSNISGYLRVLKMLTAHLQETGHQVKVMVPSGGDKTSHPPVEIIEIDSVPLPFYPELRASLPVKAIHNTISSYSPDVIHLFQPTSLGRFAATVGAKKNIPMVASFHGNIDLYCDYYHLDWLRNALWQSIQKIHNLADITLAPSPSTAQRLRQKGFKNVLLWGRGVDTVSFNPEFRDTSFWRDWNINIKQPVALYVGRIAKEKNLDIFAEFLKQNPLVQLVLVGDGPYRARLKEYLGRFSQNIHFTGYLKGEMLSCAYASADLFLFPSKTETFGQVVLESMASKLPVVVFQSDGVKDIVVHEKTGYLAESDSEWLNYASTLINNQELREQMGKMALKHASIWTWEKSMEQVVNAYNMALDKKQQEKVRRALETNNEKLY